MKERKTVMRKTHSPEAKAKIVLEVLRGEETVNEIASKHNIHPNLLVRWKTQAINSLPQVFENESVKARKHAKEAEKEKDELYQQIGKLTTQLEWVKKKSGL
jgi:transposase-like protein